MIKPGLQDYLILARQYNLVPVFTEFIADTETPISVFIKLAQNGTACLLESVEGGQHLGRYSFIALDPLLIFESTGGRERLSIPTR